MSPRVAVFAAFSAALLLPSAARAFHAADTFSVPAPQGGGGFIYYTGSPRFRRWDCSACHIDAPGQMYFTIVSEPAALLTEQTYDPEQIYDITVSMVGETKGLDSNANYNTFALEIIDQQLEPVRGFFGFDENLMRTSPAGDIIFARGQKNIEVTSWTFRWSAPAAGLGYVDMHLAGVDGNGADSVQLEQGDPLGDDVFVGALRFAERGSPAPPIEVPTPTAAGCRDLPVQDGLLVLLLPAFVIAGLRRRSRR